MAGLTAKPFDTPDETRTPDKAKMEVLDLGSVKAARLTAQPGWRWSECIKPVVGGDSCQAHHVGVIISGTMHVVHNDGTEGDITAGTGYEIQPGHDAWVVGDAPVVAYEFDSTTAQNFAAPFLRAGGRARRPDDPNGRVEHHAVRAEGSAPGC